MRETPKVSIIVPIYNVEPYLRQCLDSLVNQTYKNIEIICVDDGSVDASGVILDEYAANDKRVIALHQNNMGLSAARNAGYSVATGEYLMYVDSDDWVETYACEEAVYNASEYDADVVLWSYVREYEACSKEKRLFDAELMVLRTNKFYEQIYTTIVGLHDDFLRHPENADTLVTAWGKLYRKSIVDYNKALFVDTKYIGTEDALYNIMALRNVCVGVYVNKAMNHYRKTNVTSLTNKYKPQLLAQWTELFRRIRNVVIDLPDREKLESALNNRISLSIIGLGLNAISLPNGQAIHEIKRIISGNEYRAAIRELPMKYFPLHWWVFFACCKMNFALGVFLLLKCMDKLKR